MSTESDGSQGPHIGDAVHGVISKVRPSALHVTFGAHAGLVRRAEIWIASDRRLDQQFAELDEVEAWVLRFPIVGDRFELTFDADRAAHAAVCGAVINHAARRSVELGSGVPFWELYMQRRSKKSWDRRRT